MERQEYAVVHHTLEQQAVVDAWCVAWRRPWFLRYYREGLWHTEVSVEGDDYITLHNLVLQELVQRVTFGLFSRRD